MRSLVAAVERLDPLTVSGRVAAVNGLLIEARGGLSRLAVGARAEIDRVLAEDPFVREGVSEYEIIEFLGTKKADWFKSEPS